MFLRGSAWKNSSNMSVLPDIFAANYNCNINDYALKTMITGAKLLPNGPQRFHTMFSLKWSGGTGRGDNG